MSGPIEEGARAANSFFEIMRQQPVLLAMIVSNLLLLGFLYYTGISATKERHIEMQLLYDNRKYVTDILASCVHVKDIETLLGKKQ